MKCRTGCDNVFSVPDDRRIVITAGEIKRQFNEEYKAREAELFAQLSHDITAQLMATVLTELNLEFGFGRDRLTRFKTGVEGLFTSMAHDGILGKQFTAQNCIDLMRDKYGIDLDAVDA